MKKILSIVVLYCFLLNTLIFGQSSVESYKGFDIKNTSGQTFDAIHSEMRSGSNAAEFNSLINNERNRLGNLSTQQSNENYLKEFDELIGKTREKQQAEEFLRKTGAELTKYGVDVAANYAQLLPTKHLTNFIVPAIQRGAELATDKWVESKVKENREDLDKLIIDRLNLLYSNGVDATKANSEQEFENIFSAATEDIKSLNRDDYAVFNKELVKYAYGFIKENKDKIKLLDLKVNEQYETTKNEYTAKIAESEKRITDEVKKEFKEVGNAIANLTENQKKIFDTLDDIQVRVTNNEVRIKEIEKQMVVFKSDITKLKELQNEHSKLIAQNAFQIDVLSGYTFQNLNTEQKLNALQKGHFDNIFKKEDKDKLINELEKIKTTETIISVANDINKYANVTYDFLVSTKILKGEDAKKAGKFLHYLGAAVQIGTGVARIYAGDITGIFSVFSGIGGILSGGKPQKSPELEFLEAMYKEMQARFDDIDKRLERIDKKIDALGEMVAEMYKSIMASLQIIGGELERINWKLDNLQAITSSLLFEKYRVCDTVENVRKSNDWKFNEYSDYIGFYTTETGQCLEGLNKFSLTSDDTYFYLRAISHPNIETEIKSVYEPIRDLFIKKYGTNNKSKTSLMFPTNNVSNTTKSLLVIKKYNESSVPNFKDSLNDYLNYEMLSQFSNLFLIYSPYFEISWDDQNFKPESLQNYLKRKSQERALKGSYLNIRLQKLMRLLNNGIMQQSLLAGNTLVEPTYSILFTANQTDADIKLAIKALNNNKLFAQNFATYLLNKNLRISQSTIHYNNFSKIYEEINSNGTATPEQITQLNNFAYLNDFSFKFKEDKKLYLSISRLGEIIEIKVPEPIVILENKMVNSEGLSILLKTREQVYGKILDQNFSREFSSNEPGKEITKEHFKYFYAGN